MSSISALEIRPLAECDEDSLARFVARVLPHDLLFLDRDIREPKVLAAWRAAEVDGEFSTLVAWIDAEIVATAAIVRDLLSWSSHVAELRMLVLPGHRGKGVGRTLLHTAIGLATAGGAMKLTARMTPDQRGAITLFEETGFRGEALLVDHVCGSDGRFHDLAILSLDIGRQEVRRGVIAGF